MNEKTLKTQDRMCCFKCEKEVLPLFGVIGQLYCGLCAPLVVNAFQKRKIDQENMVIEAAAEIIKNRNK